MAKKEKISAIVIAKNEEAMIGNCLKTLGWVDEIIVVDDESADGTVEIAKRFTDKVFVHKMRDFSSQRSFALKKAKGELVFYIDADERVTPDLAKEIQSTINRQPTTINHFVAYALPRKNIFLGKHFKFGGYTPDFVVRLFKKANLVGFKGELHEQPEVKGGIGKLKNPLIHLSHRDIVSMTEKTLIFTEFEAKLRLEASHPKMSWWRFLRVMITEFNKRIIKYQGWRDGLEGFIDGIFQVFNMFIIYVRLWELQRREKRESLEETYKRIDEELLSKWKKARV